MVDTHIYYNNNTSLDA